MNKIVFALAAGAVLVTGAACGPNQQKAQPVFAQPKKSSPAKKSSGLKVVDKEWRDGTFEVGKEIWPGKYKTASVSEGGCLWERLRGLSGDVNDVINNNYSMGQDKFVVKKSDKYIKFFGGCVWVVAK